MSEEKLLREFLCWLGTQDYKIGTLESDCFSDGPPMFEEVPISDRSLIQAFLHTRKQEDNAPNEQ